MKGVRSGITDRQHEAALRYRCGEPFRSIADAMGVGVRNVHAFLIRYESNGGELMRRRARNERRSPRLSVVRNAAILARVPFETMENVALRFGISKARVEQIIIEHERRKGTRIVRYHEIKMSVLHEQKCKKEARRQRAAEERLRQRLEFLERIAAYRQQGLCAVDICRAEGVDTSWPAQLVGQWLREWEKHTGRKRYPGQVGRRPRRFDQRKRGECAP